MRWNPRCALSGARSVLYPGDFDLPAEVQSSEFGSLSSLDVPEGGINFEELMTGIERGCWNARSRNRAATKPAPQACFT